MSLTKMISDVIISPKTPRGYETLGELVKLKNTIYFLSTTGALSRLAVRLISSKLSLVTLNILV